MLASNVGQLCGIGTDFSVFLRNNYYATFDEDFKKIKEVLKSNVGDFKNASGTTILFVRNNYIGTYDKNLKKISERLV